MSEIVELEGCHAQAKNMNGLLVRTREAVSLCLKEKQLEFENLQIQYFLYFWVHHLKHSYFPRFLLFFSEILLLFAV